MNLNNPAALGAPPWSYAVEKSPAYETVEILRHIEALLKKLLEAAIPPVKKGKGSK